eukprot:2091834-Rhodomonas_salina.2
MPRIASSHALTCAHMRSPALTMDHIPLTHWHTHGPQLLLMPLCWAAVGLHARAHYRTCTLTHVHTIARAH